MEKYIAKAVDITPMLREKYGNYLRLDIVSAIIKHEQEVCFLEVTTTCSYSGLKDAMVERSDLSFIESGDDPMFSANESAFETARMFVEELTAYDMIHCTSIFTDEASNLIDKQHARETE